MLKITASAPGKPIILANLITTLNEENIKIENTKDSGIISIEMQGQNILFTTKPQGISHNEIQTDAYIYCEDEKNGSKFIVHGTNLSLYKEVVLKSDIPVTADWSGQEFHYFSSASGEISLKVNKPERILVNGEETESYKYIEELGLLSVVVNKGEGTITIK